MVITYLLAVLLGYLIGSFPTGYIAGRLLGHVDVRAMGSGRTGGTNVLRSAGKNAFFVTVIGDIAKGIIPVLLARFFWGNDPAVASMSAALAALFSVVGHNYSLFLGFKGGAGTMTGAGALLALHPLLFFLSGILPLLFTYLTRMSSIGSLLGSAIALLLASVLIGFGNLPWEYLAFFLPFTALSWYSHRPNIARLRAGTERRIGDKAKA